MDFLRFATEGYEISESLPTTSAQKHDKYITKKKHEARLRIGDTFFLVVMVSPGVCSNEDAQAAQLIIS